jgi:O-antigen biosynthesis protein WbqV
MIRLSGLEPGRDIEIAFTGIRPGERLHEILFAREEPMLPIGIEGIVAAEATSSSLGAMRNALIAIEQGLAREDRGVIFRVLRETVPDFGDPSSSAGDLSVPEQTFEGAMQPARPPSRAPAALQTVRTPK